MGVRLRCWEDDLAVHFVLCVRRLADEVEPLLLKNPPGVMTGGGGGDNLYIMIMKKITSDQDKRP